MYLIFSPKTETVLMSTHKVCFGSKIKNLGIPLQTGIPLQRGYTFHGFHGHIS